MACNAIGSYGCATVGASVPPSVGYLPFWMKQHCGQQSICEKRIYVTEGDINSFLTRTVVHNVVPTHHPPLGTTYQPHTLTDL